jgi:homotetrameric cytidine deaminase
MIRKVRYMLSQDTIQTLIMNAEKVRAKAYAPYSHYAVGAALLTEDNTIFTGCNVENASYGATICAERNAIHTAIAAGYRRFQAIAIVGGNTNAPITQYAYPCGICRQVMTEFAPPNFKIIIAKTPTDFQLYTLEDLLPQTFTPPDTAPR